MTTTIDSFDCNMRSHHQIVFHCNISPLFPFFHFQGTTEGGGPRKKRRTNYSYIPEDVKKKVVDYTKIHGTRPAAYLFNISEGTIRSWKMRGFNRPNPAIARGRKVTYGTDLDEELHLGLMAMISEQEIITVDQFTEYARKIIMERRPDLNFKCSRGWIDKFLVRHKLGVTKSEAAKVMHIVEQSEVQRSSKGMYRPKDAYFGTVVESGSDIGTDRLSETLLVPPRSLSLSDSPPGFEQHDVSENGSPLDDKAGAEKLPSGYNSYLPSGEVNEALSEKEQKRQRDAAKSMHVRDIMGKLDVISGVATNMSEEQRLEVVQHAHLHGSRSAERKYGVSETAINWLQKIPSEHALGANKMPVPLEHTFVMQGGRGSIPSKDVVVSQGIKLPVVSEHLQALQGGNTPVSVKHTFVARTQGGSVPGVQTFVGRAAPAKSQHTSAAQGEKVAASNTFVAQGVEVATASSMLTRGANVPAQNERMFVMQGASVPARNEHTFVVRGTNASAANEEVFITQASCLRAPNNNSSHTPVEWSGNSHCLQTKSVGNRGGAEAKVLAWAVEQRRNGEDVTFDGLCDQALCFVSQENPGSAYSSTRKWVDRFLNLKVRDLLNVQM